MYNTAFSKHKYRSTMHLESATKTDGPMDQTLLLNFWTSLVIPPPVKVCVPIMQFMKYNFLLQNRLIPNC